MFIFQIGTWDRRRGVNITVTEQQQKADDLERLRNTTLRVVTVFVRIITRLFTLYYRSQAL